MNVVNEKIGQINTLVEMLSDEEQAALLKVLKKQVLLAEAERLNRSVKPNRINMDQIVHEVRKVRMKRYERNS